MQHIDIESRSDWNLKDILESKSVGIQASLSGDFNAIRDSNKVWDFAVLKNANYMRQVY